MESTQAMLIIGNVLQNDTKAEAAWALLGMTTRLAQSLGLHKEKRGSPNETIPEFQKRKLW